MSSFAVWTVSYLMNAAWQIPLVFVVVWASAGVLRKMGAQAEHRLWVGALVGAVLLPACSWRLAGLLPKSAHGEGGGLVLTQVAMTGAGSGGHGLWQLPIGLVDAVFAGYLCVLVYFAVRLMWGLWRTERMRRRAVEVRLEGEMAWSWSRYCSMFKMEDAKIAVSEEVAGPVVVGVRVPSLLLPESFMGGLAVDDWEAALAHEFAHMRRRDFAKNLAYAAISLPVMWHPIARLMQVRIAESREILCDGLAAEQVQGRTEYANSLLRLESMLAGAPQPKPLHAIGIFDANTLERRVMRLIAKPVEMKTARLVVLTAACVVMATVACGSALALRMNVEGKGAAAAVAAPAPMAAPSPAEVNKELAPNAAGEMAPPHPVYKKMPVYPVEAKAEKNTLDGAVVLKATITPEGFPTNIMVVKSLRADYDQSAVDAVREWRFTPAMKGGVPVAVDTKIEIVYSIYK